MTDDDKYLFRGRRDIAIDCIQQARSALSKDLRGDLCLKMLDVVEHQLEKMGKLVDPSAPQD